LEVVEERFLTEERRRLIAAEVGRERAVRTRDLMARFAVSDMTVRRDLEALEAAGVLVRTRGGAVVSSEGTLPYRPYRERAMQRASEKTAIAQAAAALVRPGMTVAINPGTTTTAIAALLRGMQVRVVTNSLSIARAAHGPEGASVLVTGGLYSGRGEALAGEWTASNLAGVFADLAFIGFSGLKGEQYAVVDPDEAAASRSLLRTARRVVVVADSSKFSRAAGNPVAPIGAAHTIVSDDALPAAARDLLSRHGVEVILVSAANPEARELASR
jgi:DeoR/GlpR family transcriptional regulator of sugar metabolism